MLRDIHRYLQYDPKNIKKKYLNLDHITLFDSGPSLMMFRTYDLVDSIIKTHLNVKQNKRKWIENKLEICCTWQIVPSIVLT